MKVRKEDFEVWDKHLDTDNSYKSLGDGRWYNDYMYQEALKTNDMNREELKLHFFKKHQLYWIRKIDGYRFNNEECGMAIDHYIETGQEP
jgi:hypothetical protein